MIKRNSNTALLFFSRSASLEARNKAFVKSQDKVNYNICDGLIRETKKVISTLDLPSFLIDETLQEGENFGQRLANAFELIFSKGFERVIAIGNDCPTLQIKDIHLAINKLNQGENILGPNTRGGVYLIGVRKDCFNSDDFASLRWQTAHLMADLTAYFEHVGGINLLTQRNDLNTLNDIRLFLVSGQQSYLVVRLQEILNGVILQFGRWKNRFPQVIEASASSQLRAPPFFQA